MDPNKMKNITNKTDPSLPDKTPQSKPPGYVSTSIGENISIKEKYVFYDQMDNTNKKAMDVLQTKGMNAAIDYMFKDPDTGRQLSYAEMRDRYG